VTPTLVTPLRPGLAPEYKMFSKDSFMFLFMLGDVVIGHCYMALMDHRPMAIARHSDTIIVLYTHTK